MLQMIDHKKNGDLSSEGSLGQVINYALLDAACRCPGYYQEKCELPVNYNQGCFWGLSAGSNGEWCQCGDPPATPRPVDPIVIVDPVPPTEPPHVDPVEPTWCETGVFSEATAPGEWGWDHNNPDQRGSGTRPALCCAASCGECGGSSCSSRPGGGDNCCHRSIVGAGRLCENSEDEACVVPGFVTPEDRAFFTGSWNGNRNNWNGEVGVDFRANKGLTITHLGRHTYNGALAESIVVTLWSTSTQEALATIQVGPESEIEGTYGWAELASPVYLTDGEEYRLSQQCHSGMPDRWFDASSFAESQAESVATFIGGVYRGGNGYPENNDGANRRPGMLNFKFQ